MNLFEQILSDILIGGETVLPVFIHSTHGIAVLNASEQGIAAILQSIAAQTAKNQTPAPAPVTPPAQ